MALIICRDAAFGYDGGIVVSGLDFEVSSGDYLCIVGENGSGKSTLVRGLVKLISPVSGKITLSGGLRPDEIGYLPQRAETQRDFPAGVLEVVLSGRQSRRGLRPFYGERDKRAALENLGSLGVGNLKNKCFSELSGGQRQRVLLARALCATDKLLLLDEPAAGLDPPAAQELYSLILALNRERALTVVMVSHDIRRAISHATHILHLGSRQLFFGTTGEYIKTELARGFLGGDGNA